MVRTFRIVAGSYVYENRLVEGRPMAVRQIESVGEIDREDHDFIRSFLEGADLDAKMAEVCARAHGDGALHTARIFQVD